MLFGVEYNSSRSVPSTSCLLRGSAAPRPAILGYSGERCRAVHRPPLPTIVHWYEIPRKHRCQQFHESSRSRMPRGDGEGVRGDILRLSKRLRFLPNPSYAIACMRTSSERGTSFFLAHTRGAPGFEKRSRGHVARRRTRWTSSPLMTASDVGVRWLCVGIPTGIQRYRSCYFVWFAYDY